MSSRWSYSVFCFKQKTAYEMRISDWSSDVCSSDLPHLNFFRPGMADIEAVDRRYRDFYRDLPFNAVYQSLYHTVLNRMADGCAPVLIHCSAGKDRTGLFAALTLTVLGVPFEAVIAD